MKRIVIQLSELSHENWNYIYRFIERCLGSKQFRKTDFDAMQNNEIKIGIDDNPTNNDVCSMIDKGIKELRYEELAESGDYVFNIIYDKTDEREEFSDFVRFFLLKKKYAGRLTLGINLDVFKNDESFNKYKFQLGIFLFFIKDKCPLLGRHSLYLVKAENGTTKVSAIPYMIETSDINYKLASPYLLPLIPINKSNFGIFENVGTKKNEVGLYIEHSLDSIRKRLEKSRRGILNLEDCHTLFEKWLVSSFYLSLEDQGIEEFNNCKPVLLEYCHNIFELAQNIIYHTDEKQGLIYMVVNKKEKVSKTLQSVIPNFDDYEKSTRFLEFGVFDYGDKGIVRTFCEQENLINENYRLGDFFVSDKQSNLFESYNSEHLGIRSFTNSIKEHNGFFRVESNYSNSSKAIVEIANDSVLKESLDVENVNGTHYDVVIPIFNLLYSEKMAISASRNSLRNIFKEYGMKLPMYPTIQSRVIEELFLSTFDNKEEQEKRIDEAAQELLVEVSNKTNVNGVAIDMKSIDLRPSILYKIIDNLIKNNNIHKTIDEGFLFMLINLKNEIIDRVCENYDTDISLLPSNEYHFPVILIGEQWKVQILYGKTREELLYVNRRVHSLFLSRNHFGRVSLAGDNLSIKEKNRAEKFVLPYDLMIDDKNCEPLFSSFINKALDTPIENVDDAMGCKISFPTKIGSKLYIENYYEADFLFHNNFFTDRFAYFIAQEIVGKIKEINSGFFGKKLVLIGYNPYSAPLVERVKEYVNDCFVGNMVTDIVIATQKERDNDLVFKMSEKQALAFLNKKEKYNFITIVPIASTLSTTDKIIALFNKKLEDFIRNYEEKTLLFPSPTKKLRIKFVYNYVTILVRDRIGKSPTTNEKGRKWTSIRNHTINTTYQCLDKKNGGMKVDFLIQKTGGWHNLINSDTFPKNWWEEKYINQTKNASINTKEMHGVPVAALPNREEMRTEIALQEKKKIEIKEDDILKKYYDLSEKKLKEISDYICFGHLKHGESHHRYYFEIERFIDSYYKKQVLSYSPQSNSNSEQTFQKLDNWLNYVKGQIAKYSQNVMNIIITPDYDHESCFVSTINEKVFDNNAFVIYLNINGFLQDSIIKLNYLKEWRKHQESHYFFVDQALHTGNTCQKTRSCMASILEDHDFCFDGIVTMINRLSKNKYEEIRKSLKMQIMFSYLHFFVLPSKEMEKECSLCGLKEYYENLMEYSAIEDCRREIDRNRVKFEIKELSHYLAEKPEKKNGNNNKKDKKLQKVSENNRFWLRMIWRHRLFFELTNPFAVSNFEKDFDELYLNCATLDDKISFLKAITFPPLSQYVKIRAYAHRLQLEQLHYLFLKPQPDYDDLCFLLVLLKHLSVLGSNSLVRREVIINSWKLYCYVVEHYKERCRDSGVETNFIPKLVFYIKNATYKDEAKSLWLGELLRMGKKEMNPDFFGPEYKVHQTKLYNRLWYYYDRSDFNYKVLPYIFYDNTTITRKTLVNFESALEKDNSLNKLMKDKDGELRSFKNVLEYIDVIVEKYKKKIDQEYYYSWFRLFLDENCNTPDGIPLMKKFVFVLYEMLFLKNLVDSDTQNAKPFDQNAKDLLEVGMKVMDADAAFITIKDEKTNQNYILDSINIQLDENAFDNCFAERLLYEKVDEEKGKTIVIKKDLLENRERLLGSGQFNRTSYLMLHRTTNKDNVPSKRSLVGVVTFLYEDKRLREAQENLKKALDEREKKKANLEIVNTHDSYIKNAQESGRLLLLIKHEIDNYVEHVAKEQDFVIWKEKQEKNADFIRVNVAENHQLNLKGWSFGEIVHNNDNTDFLSKKAKCWFMLSDAITKHLYAQLLQFNRINYFDPNSTDHSLIELFDEEFQTLLSLMYKYQWKGSIYSPTDFSIDIEEKFGKGKRILGEIPVFQSFILQCIDNAFNHQPKENGTRIVKVKAYVDFNNNGIIEIKNQLNLKESDYNSWIEKKKQFERAYEIDNVKNLTRYKFRDYRFTLVSLMMYLDAVNGYYDPVLNNKCEFDFNLEKKPYTFTARIMFNS